MSHNDMAVFCDVSAEEQVSVDASCPFAFVVFVESSIEWSLFCRSRR